MLQIKSYKSYFKNSLGYFGVTIFSSVLGILINPLLAKNLSSGDYAIIGYFTSFNLILMPLVNFNLITFYLRKYYYTKKEDLDKLNDTVLMGILFIGFISFLLFSIVFGFYLWKSNSNMKFIPFGLFAFLQVYLSSFFTFYLTKLRINKQVKKYAIISILQSLFFTSLTLLFVVLMKEGASGKLLSAMLSALIFAIYCFKKSIVNFQIDFKLFKEAILFGIPLTLSSLLWYFLSGVDRAFLLNLNDTHTYGIYIVAIQIVSYMTIFYITLNNTFEPDIFEAISKKKNFKLLMLIGAILLVIVIVNIGLMIFAPFVIDILTAGRYIQSSPYVQILALMNITMACYYMVVKLLVGYGYVRLELLIRIISAILAIVIFKSLIGMYGFYGAAWGQVFSFLVASIIALISLLYNLNKEKKKNDYSKI